MVSYVHSMAVENTRSGPVQLQILILATLVSNPKQLS